MRFAADQKHRDVSGPPSNEQIQSTRLQFFFQPHSCFSLFPLLLEHLFCYFLIRVVLFHLVTGACYFWAIVFEIPCAWWPLEPRILYFIPVSVYDRFIMTQLMNMKCSFDAFLLTPIIKHLWNNSSFPYKCCGGIWLCFDLIGNLAGIEVPLGALVRCLSCCSSFRGTGTFSSKNCLLPHWSPARGIISSILLKSTWQWLPSAPVNNQFQQQ